MTIVATTTAVDQTQLLGGALAELARPGDVLLLAGELGAGKTALVQGFGRGLGINEAITSPTFMLARQHDGGLLRLPVCVQRRDQRLVFNAVAKRRFPRRGVKRQAGLKEGVTLGRKLDRHAHLRGWVEKQPLAARVAVVIAGLLLPSAKGEGLIWI